MPTKAILAVAALMCAVLFIATIWTALVAAARRRRRPAARQRHRGRRHLPGASSSSFKVKPSEKSLERPYIDRNIKATRAAYGLDDVDKTELQGQHDRQPRAAARRRRDDPRHPAARPEPWSRRRSSSSSRSSPYYQFPDALDVDRYTIDGKSQDTVIAVRELDLDGLAADQRNWLNDHTVYTHGFGVVAAYGNQRTADGAAGLLRAGHPADRRARQVRAADLLRRAVAGLLDRRRAQGRPAARARLPGRAARPGSRTRRTPATAASKLGCFFAQARLRASSTSEQNFLLSDAVNNESQILYDRDAARARREGRAVADARRQPLPGGRRRPGAVDRRRLHDVGRLPVLAAAAARRRDRRLADARRRSRAGARREQVNYIRNSVKATVDAYDGTVTLYAWDDQDPLLKAWTKIFPARCKPLSAIQRRPDDATCATPRTCSRCSARCWPLPRHRRRPRSTAARTSGRVPNDPTQEQRTVAAAAVLPDAADAGPGRRRRSR